MADMRQQQDAAAGFDPLRPTLLRIAYRMMGSMSDAEDVVQDAFLRWMATDRSAVRQPESFLRRTVTRLCLDQLKSARRRREVYPGEWLPEPVIEAEDEQEADDVTLPLMMALERLSPLERAAFILHDVFAVGFDEVAKTIGRDAAATRQLAARARNHVRADRPRFDLPKEKGLEIAEAFFQASRSGDMTALAGLLAADVTMHADGGGKKPATMKPMLGFEVMRFHTALAQFFAKNGSRFLRFAVISGLPGFVTMEAGDTLQTTALDIRDGLIVGIYIMRNPDKLKQVERALN
jgi:RNA polymerase sigma-70 factor (ECF subfamily)